MRHLVSGRTNRFLQLLDIAAVVFSLYLSMILRLNVAFGRPIILTEFVNITPPVLIAAVLTWVVIFRAFNIYATSDNRLAAATVFSLAKAHVLAMMAFCGILYLIYRDFSRVQALYFFVSLGLLLLVIRLVIRLTHISRRITYSQKRRVLIIGTDDYAQQIGRTIVDFASPVLRLVGHVAHSSEQEISPKLNMLGTLNELESIVEKWEIDEIIVCDKSYPRSYLQQIVTRLSNLSVNFRMAPDYSEMAYFRALIEDFAGTPLISLRYDMLSRSQRLTKRIFDIIVAAVLGLFTLPLMAVIALAIRIDSPGPVLFRQQRVGERGRHFTMMKFRTMVDDAESHITYQPRYKTPNDERITRVGHWLRRTSLDELPQFWNVLKGEMSLVGPRPELPQVVAFYSASQRRRFEMPQGMTGWWQIHGRADLPMYEHVDYDLFYIRNYSVWLDLQIIARTPLVIFRGRGAY